MPPEVKGVLVTPGSSRMAPAMPKVWLWARFRGLIADNVQGTLSDIFRTADLVRSPLTWEWQGRGQSLHMWGSGGQGKDHKPGF